MPGGFPTNTEILPSLVNGRVFIAAFRELASFYRPLTSFNNASIPEGYGFNPIHPQRSFSSLLTSFVHPGSSSRYVAYPASNHRTPTHASSSYDQPLSSLRTGSARPVHGADRRLQRKSYDFIAFQPFPSISQQNSNAGCRHSCRRQLLARRRAPAFASPPKFEFTRSRDRPAHPELFMVMPADVPMFIIRNVPGGRLFQPRCRIRMPVNQGACFIVNRPRMPVPHGRRRSRCHDTESRDAPGFHAR